MWLVVDANVLFSFFKRESATRKLITSLGIKELRKHRREICEKSKISGVQFDETLKDLKLFIDVVRDGRGLR